MSILACPSMRVTGSMVIFCMALLPIRTSPSMPGPACGPPAVRRARRRWPAAGGGQPGTCRSTFTTSCTGTAWRSSAGTPSVGTRWSRLRAFDVDPLQQLLARGIWLRMAGTLPVTAQSPSATSSLLRWRIVLDLLQVLLAADRAFDQRDVHAFGELLRVHQRPVDQVRLLGHVEDGLVHVEQRHVAAGAAVQPHRRQP